MPSMTQIASPGLVGFWTWTVAVVALKLPVSRATRYGDPGGTGTSLTTCGAGGENANPAGDMKPGGGSGGTNEAAWLQYRASPSPKTNGARAVRMPVAFRTAPA